MPDAARLTTCGDVFVLPSIREGRPVALMEAQALGIASVVTRVGGMPEMIEDGINGLVVDPADPPALATAIGRLVGDEKLRKAVSERARLTGENFDLGKAVELIERRYAEILRPAARVVEDAPGASARSDARS